DRFLSCADGAGGDHAASQEGGADHPLPYVRWPENRNMADYLRLIAAGRLEVPPLVSSTYAIEQADDAYAVLQSSNRPLLVLLSYSSAHQAAMSTVVNNPKPLPARSGAVRFALIGAGGFAKGMHLPNLHAMPNLCHLRS